MEPALESYNSFDKAIDNESDSKKHLNAFVQWSTFDGSTFFPSGRVVQQLPPGYYAMGQDFSTGSFFFKRKAVKSENLLRFADSVSDDVIRDIETFWNLESKFAASNWPYKRGIILYGPPGSGKTCILRLAVDDLINKRAGIVIDFPSVPQTFEQGYQILRQIHANMPLIVLMEDLDSILARTCESDVLNILDGINDVRKAVFLATTNYPEKLGSRILNRPSRFDKKFFVDMPSKLARETYLKTHLADEVEVKKWVEDTEGLSIAHLKELFVATKMLGDSYDQALNLLRGMNKTPPSKVFDDYNTDTTWDSFGTGRAYQAAKIASKLKASKGLRKLASDLS